MKMYRIWKKTAMLVAGVLMAQLAFLSAAQAQPDLSDAPKAENPTEHSRPVRGERAQAGRAAAEQGIRQMMTMGGINEVETQDAILAYIREDLEARRPIREQGMRLRQALRPGAATDEQLQAMIADYRTAQEAEAVRREEAQNNLDEKIGFSKNPRLEAMLLLSGVIGDGGGMMFAPGQRGGRGPGPREHREQPAGGDKN